MKSRTREFTEAEQEIILDLYTNQKRGLVYIGKQVHASDYLVRKFLVSKGIHIRSFSEAAIASNKNRATKKKEDYFSIESPSMAWLVGFIASDGSIRKDENEIKIGLSIKDKEILEKIKAELELQTEVKEYTTNTGFDCCKLQWTCEQHKKDLAKYHIIPQKTFLIKPPLALSREYWIDYIRGYFDGDGSINFINQGALRWQICGATKEILEWIVDFFFEEYQIPKVKIYEDLNRGKNPYYYFQYSTNATKRIYDILYTPNSLYLKRKKDKFEEVIKMI